MTLDFDEYLTGEENTYVSTDEEAMLVWGKEKGTNDADLLGFSYNSPRSFDEITDDGKLEMLAHLADRNDVPLLWIGKRQFHNGELELGTVELQSDGAAKADAERINLADAAAEIQRLFGTEYDEMGTAKEKNKRTAGGFHDWSRESLPRSYKKQDLDIVVTSDTAEPRYIIELKRSFIERTNWTPYRDDLRNYVLQVKSADGADAIPLIVYQNKEDITDHSEVTLFRINDVNPDAGGSNWIDTDRKNNLSAEEAKRRLVSGDLGF